MRARKLVGGALAGLLVIVLLVGAAVAWNGAAALHWALEHPVSRLIGHRITIDGPVTLRWGSPLRLVARDVHIANASWGSRPDMFVARRVEIALAPASLLRRRSHLPLIRLDHAMLLLETSRDGQANWNFAFGILRRDGRDDFPDLDRLALADGVLLFRNGRTGAETSIGLDTLVAAADGTGDPVRLSVAGRFQDLPMRLTGTLGPLTALRDPAIPYPVDLAGTLGDGKLGINGTLSDPLHLAGAELGLDLAGSDLHAVADALGVPLPPLPDFSARGRLSGGGGRWAIHSVSLRLGHSDIDGSLDIDTRGDAPYLRADLRSSLIDIADFAGFLGARPPAASGSSAPAGQSKPRGRIVPAAPIATDELRGLNADVALSLDARRFAATIGPPLDGLSAALHLRHGVLTLDPLNFAIAGGTVAAALRLDATAQPPLLALDLELRRIDLHRLVAESSVPEIFKQTRGTAGGFVRLRSHGLSLRDFLAHMDGDAGVFAAGGQFNAVLENITDLDVLKALGLSASDRAPVPVNCLMSRFDLKRGIATATSLLLDTDASTVAGRGNFNFPAETIYVDLVPHHKHFDPLTLSSPIEVRGTFAKPEISASKVSLLQRFGDAVGFHVPPPPAALLPLTDAALGPNNDCRHLFHTPPEAPAVGSSQRPAPAR